MSCFSYPVSIQLLLLFYYSINNKYGFPFAFQYNSCHCSMIERISINEEIEVFQYNSCYCSILPSIAFFGNSNGFNTTLVTVLLKAWIYFHRVLLVSIQLLLLFYTYEAVIYGLYRKFQYNSCYCSMKSTGQKIFFRGWFQYNSCYCSIHSINPYLSRQWIVSIQLLLLFYKWLFKIYKLHNTVSIQLLLLFYLSSQVFHHPVYQVSIQLLLLFYFSLSLYRLCMWRFQYNSCYCSIRRNPK